MERCCGQHHPDFQSIDGLDDAYESFHNWPLFYILGGDAQFLVDAQTEFDVITKDMARYGTGHGYPMVVKEYQPGIRLVSPKRRELSFLYAVHGGSVAC